MCIRDRVNDKDELKKNIENLLGSGNGILIEECLNGTEVSVGLMKYEDEIKVFGITEIITENDFFDYEAKYMGKSSEITPARIPNEIKGQMMEKVFLVILITGG